MINQDSEGLSSSASKTSKKRRRFRLHENTQHTENDDDMDSLELPGAVQVPGIGHDLATEFSILPQSSGGGPEEQSTREVLPTERTNSTMQVVAEIAPDYDGVVAEREALRQELAKKEQELHNHMLGQLESGTNVVQAEVIKGSDDNYQMFPSRCTSRGKFLAAAAILFMIAAVAAAVSIFLPTFREPSTKLPLVAPTIPPTPSPPTEASPTSVLGSPTLGPTHKMSDPSVTTVNTEIDWIKRGSIVNGFAEAISGNGTVLAVSSLDILNVSYITVYEYFEEAEEELGDWVQLGEPIPGHKAGLSNDGMTLAVGVTFQTGEFSTGDTFVVYQLNITDGDEGINRITEWVPLGSVDNDLVAMDAGPLEEISLSADGKIVALGYPTYDLPIWGTIDDQFEIIDQSYAAGVTQVLKLSWDEKNWIQIGSDIIGTGCEGHSGAGVALANPNWEGPMVAIGAPRYDPDQALYGPGQVRVYQYKGVDWEQVGQSLDGNTYDGPSFGESLDLSQDGATLAIGAVGGENDNGYVRVFRLDDNNIWAQIGDDLGIDTDDTFDNFGRSVTLSMDGSRLAVSYERVPPEDTPTTRKLERDRFDWGRGVYPSFASIYEYDEGKDKWIRIGDELSDGEYTLLSPSGRTVVTVSLDDQIQVYDTDE